MTRLSIRPVETRGDLALLDDVLRRLSRDLGDTHAADRDALATALWGTHPSACGIVATAGDDLRGAALFAPLYSTVVGAAGAYVSDLWVADAARGQGMGRLLLAHVAQRAHGLWRARWMTLAVYHESTESRRFYERLGFNPKTAATTMHLDPDGMEALMDATRSGD